MTARTCDLRQLTDRIRDAAPDRRPTLVGVSGFAASAMTDLAARLGEILTGAAVLRADLLAATAPRLMTGDWAANQRQELRRRLPGRAEVVVVQGGGLLHPDLADLFHLRVWLDVDLERATMQDSMRAYEQARRAGGPAGHWEAGEPPERVIVDASEAEFFARFRPDRVADVLFVPVGGLTTPVRLRFMAETGCDFLLWDDDNEHLEQLEHLLPMPAELRRRVLQHAEQWSDYDGGHPGTDWPGREQFDRRGYLLSRELQEALGPDYRVSYFFSTAAARRWAAKLR
jgi:hypothetical protein